LRLIKGTITSLPPYSFTVDAETVSSLSCFWCEHHVEPIYLRRLWKLCRFKVCLFAFCILYSCSPHILLSVSVVRLEALYVCLCVCVWLTKGKWGKKLLTSLSQNIGKWNICVFLTWCSCRCYMYNNILSYQLDSECMRTVFLGLLYDTLIYVNWDLYMF